MIHLRIPPARLRQCVGCGADLDCTAPGVGEYVSGIAVNRTGGGANAITERRGTGRYLCRECVHDRQRGTDTNQPSLFG